MPVKGKRVSERDFDIVPSDIPNRGILFVDHQKNGRSGHGGNCLTECKNGDIVSFYSNVSGEIWGGHSIAGWSEYRRSKDGGKTWGDPVVFDYSKKMWDGDQVYSAIVFAVVTAPDGTLIAVAARFDDPKWVKKYQPVYLLSRDHGQTWGEPQEFDASATVEDLSLTFDAAFVHNDTVFLLFMGGGENYCPGPYSLYASEDNGTSFEKRSILPFDHRNYYLTAGVLDDGQIIAYSYPYRGRETDEHNIDYVISKDEGCSWSGVKTAFFSKKIRNPQLSEKIGDYYFIHGRSGSYGENSGNFVLYTSEDGITWDDGLILYKKEGSGGDAYSANTAVGKYGSQQSKKLLIQSSISYDGSKVNECQWWVENIRGT